MKIAFILPSLAKKGPIVYTQYLIQGLQGKVDYIKVFYFNDIVELDMGVDCEKISFYNMGEHLKDFDVIHTHCAKPDLYAMLNPQIRADKWITTFHDMFKRQLALTHPLPKATVLSFIYSFAVKRVKNAVVFNSAMLDYYKRMAGDKNYYIIPTGVPQAVPQENIPHDELQLLDDLKNKYTVIGSSGLLIKRKGYAQLIDFLTLNENYACVIVGDGEERGNLEQYAREKGVESRFKLLGFKTNAVDYYTYFDIFALTSYAEGLPLSLLEAMSLSLPIVCSKLDNYNDYFTDDDVCFFELDQIDSLSKAVYNASEHKEHFSLRSQRLYAEKFSLEHMVDHYLRIYTELARK